MNASVAIVSCAKHKRPSAMAAEDLYSSETFFGARRYAQARFDHWLILSAKHGLIAPGQEIAPYDQHIATLSPAQLKNLASRIEKQVAKMHFFDRIRRNIVTLCSQAYNDALSVAGVSFEVDPVGNVPEERKADFLKVLNDPMKSEPDLDSLYSIIDKLIAAQGLKPLREAIRDPLPEAGVYIFFDKDENRLRDLSKLRIVRIGTHGVAANSKASLRDRIRTHFGTTQGSGNHRSSIFRSHVGRSLIRQGKSAELSSWGQKIATPGEALPEIALEQQVSKYIGDLLVAFIAVPGGAAKSNDRAYLEQNLIALISNALKPLDPASHKWLGLSSDKPEVRKSGLWNVNHTAQTYDPAFLQMLDYYVALTVGREPAGKKPVAPADWLARSREDFRQPSLLG